MPERLKVVTRLTERAVGGPIVWNGAIGEPIPGQLRPVVASFVAREPVEVTSDVWDKTAEEADAIYETIMGLIDFNRVLINASGLHLDRTLKATVSGDLHADSSVGEICGECIRDALLAKDR